MSKKDKKIQEELDALVEKSIKDATEEQIIDAELADALFEIETGGITRSDPNLPPEIREAFMNQIRAFEEQLKNGAITVPIRELIGEPEVEYIEEVAPYGPVAIRRETGRLTKRIEEAGFAIERPEDMSNDSSWYRFLSEILLEHEVIPTPTSVGSVQSIQYLSFEEIIADQVDIEMLAVEAFLLNLFNLDEPFGTEILADYVQLKGESVPQRLALNHINNWRKQFSSITPISFGELEDAPEMPKVEGSDGIPKLFGLDYEVTYHNGQTKLFEGVGVCLLVQEDEFTPPLVVGASFPGFEL